MLEVLRRYPDVVHVETESVRVLPEALGELTRREVDLLVVNGGDGTLQYVLTELLDATDLPALRFVAPLRGGRTNMTACDLGADPRPATRSGRAARRRSRSGRLDERLVARPVLRIASTRRSGVQYGMFFGAGMISARRRAGAPHLPARPAGRVRRRPGHRGAADARSSPVRATASSRPTRRRSTWTAASCADAEFYLLIASTLSHLFLRMNPFWGERTGRRAPDRGREPRAAQLRWRAPGILRGRPRALVTPENGYESANAQRAQIGMGCGFTIDGEIFAPEPDEVVELCADRRLAFVRA